MNTYAVLLVDRFESGRVDAFQWKSSPYLTLEEAEDLAEVLKEKWGDAIEVHRTVEGFNVWNADII